MKKHQRIVKLILNIIIKKYLKIIKIYLKKIKIPKGNQRKLNESEETQKTFVKLFK